MGKYKPVIVLILLSLVTGAVMSAWLVRGGSFVTGWLASSLLLALGTCLLYILWKAAGGGKLLAWMVALAFLLRLGSGIALDNILPNIGSTSPEVQAGHIFTDSFNRDQAAWDLAKSSTSIWASFQGDFISDQYGGLLALSATVYRYVSPDLHRPYLIQILAALAAALGIPFFWIAVRKRWNLKVAQVATWILVLYPESILLGSYQMREPFLISLAAIAFWAVVTWPERKLLTASVFVGSLVGIALFSSEIVLPVAAFFLVWLLVDWTNQMRSHAGKIIIWSGLAIAGAVIFAASWEWLFSQTNWDFLKPVINSGVMQPLQPLIDKWNWFLVRTTWDIKVSIQNSGVLQAMIPDYRDHVSNGMRLFVVGYGIAQPVLPAALIDPGAKILLQVIAILRAAGWYLLLPLLVYSILVVWKAPAGKERRALILLMLAGWVWIFISSMRGGGDQWDNPRYRVIFLPWMAIIAGWAWDRARSLRDAWLWRLVAVELVFVLVFTEWYISRKFAIPLRPSFPEMALIIGGLALLILGGGFTWDIVHKNRRAS